MIIPALVRLYDRLAAEGDASVAPPGYSRQLISFKVVLNTKGTLHAIEPVFITETRGTTKKVKGQETTERKETRRPEPTIVPGQAKPTGSGINPGFLWDNAAYLLGFKPEDLKPERTKKAFEALRDRHLALRKEIDEPAFDAVCMFLESWKPGDAGSHPELAEIATNFGVFQIRAEEGYVHNRPAIRKWWDEHEVSSQEANDEFGEGSEAAPSLVDGQTQPIARLHEPKIKGVEGAQMAGAMLVSFNQAAFRSYGKDQGANAPVGAKDAFKYCTALNRLTTDKSRRVRLAGDTLVFWSEGAPKAEQSFAEFLDAPAPQTDSDEKARQTYERAGRGLADDRAIEDPLTPFYVLSLSPNNSRLGVRLWLVSTVAEVLARVRAHHDDLAMEPSPPDAPPLTIRRLIAETAPPERGFAAEDRVSPVLAAGVMRAILLGTPYPAALLSGVVARCRVEGLADSQSRNDWKQAQHRRCAIIRACISRAARAKHQPEEVPVSDTPDHPSLAYQLGRLFAVLERVQQNALGQQLNTTIKDRYYGAASGTPASVFPRLLKLTQHHLGRITNPGQRITREKELGSIMDHLERFPRLLALEDQGLFAIGYYHRRQAYFATPPETDTTAANA